MARAAIYTRLSNESEESTSLQRQEKTCRDEANKLGIEVVKVLQDDGISGYSGKRRPAFLEAIAGLKSGEFDTIIIWKLDRLSRRGIGQMGEVLDVLEATSSRLIAVMDGIDTQNNSSRMMIALLSEMARSESSNTSVRVRAAKQEHREAGKWLVTGKVPFGYVLDENQQLKPCPENGAYARKAIEMVLNGAKFLEVVNYLNSKTANNQGKPFGKQWISYWLKSPSLAGLQTERGGRGVLYRSPETGEPVSIGIGLATEAEWRTIRESMSSRYIHNPNRKRSSSPLHLVRVVHCGHCGTKMTSNGLNNYVCQLRANTGTCSGVTIRPWILEPPVDAMVLNRIASLDWGDPALVRVAEAWRGEVAPVENVAGHESHLADLQARLDDLTEDRYSRNRFKGREELFNKLFDQLSAEIEAVQVILDNAPTTNPRQHFVDFSDPETLREAWEHARPDEKRAVTDAVVARLTVWRQVSRSQPVEERISVEWRD